MRTLLTAPARAGRSIRTGLDAGGACWPSKRGVAARPRGPAKSSLIEGHIDDAPPAGRPGPDGKAVIPADDALDAGLAWN